MTDISAYRLTIIGGVVVLVLSVGLITVIAPTQAAQYITLVGSIAIPGLLALFRLETSAKQNMVRHEENIGALNRLVDDNAAVKRALLAIKDSDMTLEEAAHKAADAMPTDADDPSLGGVPR